MFKDRWIQFCRNTSLHGWKYTVLPKTTSYERLSWMVVCLAALIGAIILVLTAWFQFQNNPIITVTESTQYPIYKFVFPAVTICNINKVSKKHAYNLASGLVTPNKIPVELLAHKLSLLFQLTNNDNQNVSKEYYEKLQKILDENKRTSGEIYKIIAPSCNTLLKKCIWKNKVVRCDRIFETIKTFIGYCCSFNYFALKNYSFSGTFSTSLPNAPRRISACGYQSGLEVLLNNEPNDYFATHIPSIGSRVFIHYPYDFLDWAVKNIFCEMNTNNFIGINPTIITASERIRKSSILQRKCLYPDERQLINFSAYSFHNCMVECRMILALEHCGCVPFYFLFTNGSEKLNSKECTLEDIHCLVEHEHLMFNDNDSYLASLNTNYSEKCNCLPNCESEFYTLEASHGVLDGTYSINQYSINSELPLDNHTVIRVFFNDLVGTRLRKDSLFTWHTLLGYYGGIMGLCTGFSFISLVEIIYFATRFASDLINKKKNNLDLDENIRKFTIQGVLEFSKENKK